MTRSEINQLLRQGNEFLKEHRFELPPFAYWRLKDWRGKGREIHEIVDRKLGWDITDFGSGDYENVGLFLFTLRNGNPADLEKGRGKLYGEKVLVVDVDQVTPMHLHKVKTEDIINRGGGRLGIKLYHSTEDGELADREVLVHVDGVPKRFEAGGTLVLQPGESVTLPDGLYHEFWGMDERVLVGEVSLVNDDATDNYFHETAGRFPEIEEDEEPLFLLVSDYDMFIEV